MDDDENFVCRAAESKPSTIIYIIFLLIGGLGLTLIGFDLLQGITFTSQWGIILICIMLIGMCMGGMALYCKA